MSTTDKSNDHHGSDITKPAEVAKTTVSDQSHSITSRQTSDHTNLSNDMTETKVIYHLDEEETPYLIKIPISPDDITLGDLKKFIFHDPNCTSILGLFGSSQDPSNDKGDQENSKDGQLSKSNSQKEGSDSNKSAISGTAEQNPTKDLATLPYKFFFKSMDDDFGVVKEEIIDDKTRLPSFKGRVICWIINTTLPNPTASSSSNNNITAPKNVSQTNNTNCADQNLANISVSKKQLDIGTGNNNNQGGANMSTPNFGAPPHTNLHPSNGKRGKFPFRKAVHDLESFDMARASSALSSSTANGNDRYNPITGALIDYELTPPPPPPPIPPNYNIDYDKQLSKHGGPPFIGQDSINRNDSSNNHRIRKKKHFSVANKQMMMNRHVQGKVTGYSLDDNTTTSYTSDYTTGPKNNNKNRNVKHHLTRYPGDMDHHGNKLVNSQRALPPNFLTPDNYIYYENKDDDDDDIDDDVSESQFSSVTDAANKVALMQQQRHQQQQQQQHSYMLHPDFPSYQDTENMGFTGQSHPRNDDGNPASSMPITHMNNYRDRQEPFGGDHDEPKERSTKHYHQNLQQQPASSSSPSYLKRHGMNTVHSYLPNDGRNDNLKGFVEHQQQYPSTSQNFREFSNMPPAHFDEQSPGYGSKQYFDDLGSYNNNDVLMMRYPASAGKNAQHHQLQNPQMAGPRGSRYFNNHNQHQSNDQHGKMDVYGVPFSEYTNTSITESTMSLNVITVILNMDVVNILGISIVGKKNFGKSCSPGITVGAIMEGGAVARDGRIEPGDLILEVNDVSLDKLSSEDAINLLKEAVRKPGPVKLVVAKTWDTGSMACQENIDDNAAAPYRYYHPQATHFLSTPDNEASKHRQRKHLNPANLNHSGGSSSTASGSFKSEPSFVRNTSASISQQQQPHASRSNVPLPPPPPLIPHHMMPNVTYPADPITGQLEQKLSNMRLNYSENNLINHHHLSNNNTNNVNHLVGGNKNRSSNPSATGSGSTVSSGSRLDSILNMPSSGPPGTTNSEEYRYLLSIINEMCLPNSGLEIKDRNWLKLTIKDAFLGSDLVDWLNMRGYNSSSIMNSAASSSAGIALSGASHNGGLLASSQAKHHLHHHPNTHATSSSSSSSSRKHDAKKLASLLLKRGFIKHSLSSNNSVNPNSAPATGSTGTSTSKNSPSFTEQCYYVVNRLLFISTPSNLTTSSTTTALNGQYHHANKYFSSSNSPIASSSSISSRHKGGEPTKTILPVISKDGKETPIPLQMLQTYHAV